MTSAEEQSKDFNFPALVNGLDFLVSVAGRAAGSVLRHDAWRRRNLRHAESGM
ncbi:hypothetical protein [Streptomyces sp. ALI-76-A]|uniref:hypothetical protein n=1 Tax=Streptomyces sp. ALI-76-A TaxID=3025736 RepID=UPI00256EA880|nr:hypothetical protein [Streptomyces sp. ALI-76-A]MDL5202781.1 hypothetical protein [Streptomyces sp. ALI-76-A]